MDTCKGEGCPLLAAWLVTLSWPTWPFEAPDFPLWSLCRSMDDSTCARTRHTTHVKGPSLGH